MQTMIIAEMHKNAIDPRTAIKTVTLTTSGGGGSGVVVGEEFLSV